MTFSILMDSCLEDYKDNDFILTDSVPGVFFCFSAGRRGPRLSRGTEDRATGDWADGGPRLSRGTGDRAGG